MNAFAKGTVPSLRCLCGAAALTMLLGGTARAQWEELLAYVPDDANAIVAIDVEGLLATPLAEAEGWKTQRQGRRLDRRVAGVQPTVQRLLAGAQVDVRGLEPVWLTGILDMAGAPDVAEFAERVGGSLDRIEGLEAVLTPNETYVIKLASQRVGALHPVTRQAAARWLADSKSGAGPSAYLRQAVARISPSAQFVAALDLNHLVSAQQAREFLLQSAVLEDAKFNVDELAELFSTVQGMMLTVYVDQRAFGNMRVEFNSSTEVLADLERSKPLILEILADMGAGLDEFSKWRYRVDERAFVLEGELEPDSVSQLLELAAVTFDASVLGTPSAGDAQPVAEGEQAEEPADPKAEASLEYFRKAVDILESLKDYKGGHPVGYAKWCRSRASQLDTLPVLNVDDELVNLTLATAAQLRQAGNGLQKTNSRAVVARARNHNVNYSYRYGTRRAGNKTRITRQAKAQAIGPYFKIMDDVQATWAQMRVELTQRYGVEF